MTQKIRIGIDARVTDGQQGGVQQAIIGLAQGLSLLQDSPDFEYVFVVYRDQIYWLEPYIHYPCSLHIVESAPVIPAWKRPLRRLTGLRRVWHYILLKRGKIRIPQSDGMMEALSIHLIHFPTQKAFKTTLPNIYQPWDLQHNHIPQFFTAFEREHRNRTYQAFCHQANIVIAASRWIKQDLIAQYDLEPDKIQIIPMASVIKDYPQPDENNLQGIREAYGLPETFAYYPAHTWKHKNHLVLLEAIAMLRDKHSLRVPLVLTGSVTVLGHIIHKRVRQLNLTDQVFVLGYVSQIEVQALYRLSRLLVFPSRFEGWGLPITEAMSIGLPIVCSNATHLADLVGDAGLTFDPNDVETLTDHIRRVWTEPELHQILSENGLKRSALFNWENTAKLFRATYRHVLRIPLTEDDQELLSAPPLV